MKSATLWKILLARVSPNQSLSQPLAAPMPTFQMTSTFEFAATLGLASGG
jgi:hypothetical protein